MATWTRSFSADLIGSANTSLTGPADLDTDTAPGDFDPSGVDSVRVQFTLSHLGTFDTKKPDSFALQSTEIQTSGSVQLATVASSGTMTDGTDTVAIDLTDNSPNLGASVADWEGARFDSVGATIATRSANGGPDNVTPQILSASVTVTITYTPSGVDDTAVLTTAPASSVFPAVTAVGEVNATATGTIHPVSSVFDPVTATGEINADATAPDLPLAATFDPVTTQVTQDATAPLPTLAVTA